MRPFAMLFVKIGATYNNYYEMHPFPILFVRIGAMYNQYYNMHTFSILFVRMLSATTYQYKHISCEWKMLEGLLGPLMR